MNKRQIIALLSCLIVGMAGFVGAYTAEKSQEQEEQEAQAREEQEISQQASTIVNPGPAAQPKSNAADEISKASEETEPGTETVETMASAESDAENTMAESTESDQEEKEATETIAEAKDDTIHFTPQDGLRWPLEGDVILNYSMDHRVYFETLQQYQYNPALVIGGEVNDKVYIIAKGTITDISTNEETGCTVTEDLGDGYTAIYGQLKELNFEVGDHVERGQVIGYVSEPTKYYSLEGSNLYFAMKKDGEPIDPLEYFE